MQEKTVMGIDGGGTRTRLVIATSSGNVLGMGHAGPSNYDDVGEDGARENIQSALEQAWQKTGRPPYPVDAAFFGMAGVVSASDRAIIQRIAQYLHLAGTEKISVDHDIRIALAGGLSLKPGIVLIAGTGSSCYGRNAHGDSCRVGGWGHLIDDDGSSYSLGLEAIKAVVRSVDGRMGRTSLVDAILKALGIQDPQEILHRIYCPMMSRAEIATLASTVLETAQQGDAIARDIVRNGQKELARLVCVANRRLAFPPDSIFVTVSGGLACSGDYFKQSLYTEILERIPQAQITEPVLSPVFGAALLALESIGESPSPEVIAKLRSAEKNSK